MYQYFDYSPANPVDRIGGQSEAAIEEFLVYLETNYSEEEVAGYFVTPYQFFNDRVGGGYFPPLAMLQEISDALNINLNQKTQVVTKPEKPFGSKYPSSPTPNVPPANITPPASIQEPTVTDSPPILKLTTNAITITCDDAKR